MKIIRRKDIKEMTAEEVKPGMVIVEGVILDVAIQQQTTRKGSSDIVWMHTANGTTWQERGKPVQVLAEIELSTYEAIQETYKEA